MSDPNEWPARKAEMDANLEAARKRLGITPIAEVVNDGMVHARAFGEDEDSYVDIDLRSLKSNEQMLEEFRSAVLTANRFPYYESSFGIGGMN